METQVRLTDKNHLVPLTEVSLQILFPFYLAAIIHIKNSWVKIIFILIIVSLIIALGFLGAFFWAVRSGQYDDDITPSIRMLFDDPPSADANKKKT